MTVRFKICGLTRADDVAIAIDAGASAIGFVLWPRSPRSIPLGRAADLARSLPPFVVAVPVLVEPSLDEIAEATVALRTGHVQLHGSRLPEATSLGHLTVLRAASPDGAATVPEGWRLLLDAHDPERHGGTGRVVDWTRAAEIAAGRPTVLAGGLGPENVAEAIARVRPVAVDVASGVEIEPGRKSHEAIRAFAAAVRDGGGAA